MLLDIPIKINELGSERLFNALIDCSVIQDSTKRKNLIKLLDKPIVNNIGSTDSPNDTVISILEAFKGFPNKIDELLEAIKRLDSLNTDYEIIHKVIFYIAREQQKQNIESASNSSISASNALFGISNIEANKCENNFESLWSELCSILDEIEWKDIWKACRKIENFLRNIDIDIYKDKEILIKSLCFTKNYEFLKQVFIDQYEPIQTIIQLGENLEKDNENSEHNEKIKLWLDKAKPKLKGNEALNEHKINKNKSYLPPILLILIDKLGDGKDQGKWNVRGQFKSQGQLAEIFLSKNQSGIDCSKFENIPTAIKSYIDYLEKEPQFQYEAIDELRVEVFIPIFHLHYSLDNWAIICEKETNRSLVEEYRLFLRSRERTRKNSRIGLLRKGWKKLDYFLEENCEEISKTTVTENIKDTQPSHIIEIVEDTTIHNWKDLEILMKKCRSLWGIRLKGFSSMNTTERIRFFESIFGSGIPIAFWNWYSIPSQVQFEQKFMECLCRNNLSQRCHQLLEKTWELRCVPWGAKTETERKQYPGYYLGMLLEDPEILPEENPLQTIGVN